MNPFTSKILEAAGARQLSFSSLVSVDQISDTDLDLIFELAEIFREAIRAGEKKFDLLDGKILINFFAENSTRTRSSHEIAAKMLGMSVVNVDGAKSSAKKGETSRDTLATFEALAADAFVIRTSEDGLPKQLSEISKIPIVNAGDGKSEHPTQALLEYVTLRRRFGDKKLNYLFVGDATHSRVFGSQAKLYSRLGWQIGLVAPPELIPQKLVDEFGIQIHENLDEAIENADAVHAIRLQRERLENEFALDPDAVEAALKITADRAAKLKIGGVVLHAGPVMRDRDIDSDVLVGENCLVEEMVESGLCVRAALLLKLLT